MTEPGTVQHHWRGKSGEFYTADFNSRGWWELNLPSGIATDVDLERLKQRYD